MQVRLLKRSFIDGGLQEAGSIIEVPDKDKDGKPTVLADHMEKMTAKPAAAPAKPSVPPTVVPPPNKPIPAKPEVA